MAALCHREGLSAFVRGCPVFPYPLVNRKRVKEIPTLPQAKNDGRWWNNALLFTLAASRCAYIYFSPYAGEKGTGGAYAVLIGA